MPGPWQRRLARVDAAVDRHWSELLAIIPWKSAGQYSPAGPDPERATIHIQAVLITGRGEADLGGAPHAWHVILPTGQAEVHIRQDSLPANYEIRLGDRIRVLDRPGRPQFEVARPDRHQLGRLIYRLNNIG